MNEPFYIDVTDIKQYVCCPRLVYYRYCLPDVRPLTYSMEVGIQAHQQEEEREVRRSLRTYQIEQGERLFHYPVSSDTLFQNPQADRGTACFFPLRKGEYAASDPEASHEIVLGVKGKIDLVLVVPSWEASEKEVVVVEYKYSEQKAGPHFKAQLAAYALLLEEALHIPVRRSFVYSIPLRKAEAVPITPALRRKVQTIIQEIKQLMQGERMPEPTTAQRRCLTCEFRRFCNDVV